MAQTYTGAGFAIADNTAAGSSTSIAVTDTGTLTSLNWVSVNFAAPGHTWVGDLVATLSNGVHSVHLFSRLGSTTASGVGDSSNLLGNYRFFNTGASFLTEAGLGTSAYNMTPGDYARSTHAAGAAAGAFYNANDYTAFTGDSLAGTWTLNISDNAGGDTGSVADWKFNVTATPEPTTWAALGLGAVAVMRRRRKA